MARHTAGCFPVNGGQLQLRGKFSEDHPIARGISYRGGLHIV